MIKYAFDQVSINPEQPYKQAGFAQQISPISEVHDNLFCRIAYFETNEIFVHCSLDSLGITQFNNLKEKIEQSIHAKSNKPVHLVMSATHTHFAPDAKEAGYFDFLYRTLIKKINQLHLTTANQLTYAFNYAPFKGIGTCRISTSNTDNIFAETLTIYNQEKRIATFLIHNCHPTIMNGDTPFFSSEYPGLLIAKLQADYPGQFFTFMQGAAGDVSTRFTRKSQDYDSVIELSDCLFEEFKRLLALPQDKKIMNLSYFEKTLELKHELLPIDNLPIDESLSEREKITLLQGVEVNKNHRRHLDELPKSIQLSCLSFGEYQIVFSINELFSSYIDALNRPTSSLVCYSNGYGPYVTGVDFNLLTYESLSGTFSNDTKKAMMQLIYDFTHNN